MILASIQPAALDAVPGLAGRTGSQLPDAFLIALIVIIGYGQPTGTTTIDEVLPGSAAQEAGLRAGDALAEINGKSVAESSAVTKIVRGSAGAPVTVKVMRGVAR